ncbi:DUF4190 domain-containing protein [Amycolatopsis sp. AA4]|uniref:DUF4190 domain-containing protein n=1 Tax=Actinomycetes TaxID=1760 RepID=UPI0001B53AF6|nr:MULTISPECIES: DUF4190 domain-containing protein [Actinomycetes]ATY13927.1 DUF4190 domain-containing protein [Amycolatopsis sp. AA4]EFL09936.1 predicted protein [Streptomyces sp. AA4]
MPLPKPTGPSYEDAPPPAEPRGTNGFAIASLILAIPAFSLPLSIAFGVIALRQTRVFGNPGRGLAIAGLSISGAWVAALLIGLAVASPSPDPLFHASPGDCFRSGAKASPVSCEDAHDIEVFRLAPGGDSLRSACEAEAKEYFASSVPPDYVHVSARQPSTSDSPGQHAVCTLETDFPTTGRVVH